MPQLRVKTGPEKGMTFSLDEESMKIGRDSSCEITVTGAGVSRKHAEIYRVSEMFFVRDLQSRNGTLVNGAPVQDELLREGDSVQIGNCQLVFESAIDDEDEIFQPEDEPTADNTICVTPTHAIPENIGTRMILSRFRELAQKGSNLDVVMKGTLDILHDLFEVQETYIFLVDGKKLRQQASRLSPDAKGGKASKSVVLRALREGSVVLSSNVREDFRFKTENTIMMNRNINSILCVPIEVMGNEVGVIYLSNGPGKEPFTEESADAVSLVAFQLSLLFGTLDNYDRARREHVNTLRMLSTLAESRIPLLKSKGERVGRYCRILGRQSELSGRRLTTLNHASYLHHVGYLLIPEAANMKLEDLQQDRTYVEKTLQVLELHGGFSEATQLIRTHRARLDGTGIPNKLPPEGWSLESQILALAVELDLRINLPLIDQSPSPSIDEIVRVLLADGERFLTDEAIELLEEVYDNGHLTAV